jgi:hypothetical protein
VSATTLIPAVVTGMLTGWATGALLLRDGARRSFPAAWGIAGATTTWLVFSWLVASRSANPLLVVATTIAGALLLTFAACVVTDSREDRRRRYAQIAAPAPLEDSAQVRRALIQALLSDATAQDAGHAEDVGRRASFVLARLADARYPVPKPIHTALSFWSGWIDAQRHGWEDAEFERAQWPVRARGIAADLAKSADIRDPAIVRLFAERHARPVVDPA